MENTNVPMTDPTTMTNESNSPATAAAPSPEEILLSMKETMVPRTEVEKWQSKYNNLFQSVANGTFSGEDNSPKLPTEAEAKATFEANIKKIGNAANKVSPLELYQTMLDIDDYLTSHGQRSGFAPSEGEITPEIEASCEKTRELLRATIERAEGSDEVAMAYLGNHLVDAIGTKPRR